jgi:cellulose synthase operon protein C
LAQCLLLLGDAKQADDLISKVVSDEGESAGPEALRIAAIVSLNGNRLDKVEKFLNKLDTIANLPASERAWTKRTRATVLLSHGRPVDRDRALRLVEQNLLDDPDNADDRQLRAAILALQPGRRGEAIKILEEVAGADRLSDSERFLLAQLYLEQREEQRYQDEMLKLLNRRTRDPRHLVHFIDFWIGRNQLDQADRWLAALKMAEPRGLATLEREARLLDLRNHRPELLALLDARGRQVPEQIGPVADLLNHYGFAKQAEEAYKAFIAREPKQADRVLALANFLARRNRVAEAMGILTRARSTCRPEQVALAAVQIYNAPCADDTQRAQVKTWLSHAIQNGRDVERLEPKLGTILYLERRFDEAEAIYRKILNEHPDDAESLNGLAWILAMRDPSKAEEALGLINRAIESRGTLPSLVDTRGVVLIRANQFDQALRDLRIARAADPANPNYTLHLAWAFHASGNSVEARKELREADKHGLWAKISDPLSRKVVETMRQVVTSN